MDRLYLMEVFVAVTEESSFAGAARRLGTSPPAVTRAVAALEAHLGVKLLDRTTRYVRVTEAVQRYFDDARRIIAEADAADESVAGANGMPRGMLAVTAPVLFGKMFVLPGITDYLRQYPDMEVTATFLDRVVNLLEEGFDVGVRIGELPDSGMRALRVGEVYPVICAAPQYLAAHGTPGSPDALHEHTVVSAIAVTPLVEWKFTDQERRLTIRVRPRLTISSNDCAIDAARSGFGLTRVMSYQAAPYLASGELVEVLPAFRPATLPVHVLHREGRYASAKIRSFVDLIAARLRKEIASAAMKWEGTGGQDNVRQ
ncbi:LysR family transcriptional regulator [Duganella violaceipulchra]|uniref:DNA-binding transcriptional LysR family regulator n=1 Tax=Duganella violaceipulchra TaxID=2849652 RepID=A0AA41H808_9BURK|nr:LysR family transcriptional regulator [Duganella violaceicalia]MBV6323778.1 LysR family transcriptional regulator [Duganella violaceicalia]MCP2007468.1 DNA-binding transcriptional LysR family regulator [Duganella violaceicalia]